MERGKVTIEQAFYAPIGEVWQALTDKDQMRQWYFELEAFKPEIGFEFQFQGGSEEKPYQHICKITEVDPEKKIGYSWQYAGIPGVSYVTFELFQEVKATKLRLTHEGLENFPKDNPDLAEGNFAEGWEKIISGSLRQFLEKAP